MSLEAQDVHNDSPTEIRPQKKETQNQSHKFSIFWNKTKQANLDTKAPNKKKQKMTPFLGPPSSASQGSK